MPRNRAAAIVIHDNKVLVMYRKNDREYFTFPGGGIEKGETNEQAVVREVREETSIDVDVEKLVYELHYDNGDTHYYFVCTFVAGIPELQQGTNEYIENEIGKDIHIPKWLSLDDALTAILYPIELRDRLRIDVSQNFSNTVQQVKLKAVN